MIFMLFDSICNEFCIFSTNQNWDALFTLDVKMVFYTEYYLDKESMDYGDQTTFYTGVGYVLLVKITLLLYVAINNG
jgi:hypothetical protein